MWVTRLSIVDWVYFKTQTLLATLRTRNQTRGDGSRTFVTISWMCKKQTSVSHSSTESEIISLDAGLRIDGLSALDLWDTVIEVLRSSKSTESQPMGQQETAREITNPNPNKRETEILINCHMWSTSAQTHNLTR